MGEGAARRDVGGSGRTYPERDQASKAPAGCCECELPHLSRPSPIGKLGLQPQAEDSAARDVPPGLLQAQVDFHRRGFSAGRSRRIANRSSTIHNAVGSLAVRGKSPGKALWVRTITGMKQKRLTTHQNGVGAFILQCKRLDFHYCDWAGSSKGMK